jgi:asparagine synthase (glutamine-hydrolysing)
MSQQGRVPAAALQRPKQGFNAPVSHWLLSSFRSAFEAMTVSESGPQLFQRAFVQQLWDDHASGRRDNGHKLLGLINLQLWCQAYHPRLH